MSQETRIAQGMWGAIVINWEFDVGAQKLTITLQVEEPDGSRFDHAVDFAGVKTLSFRNEIDPPWAYAELSEMYGSKLKGNLIRVEVLFWNEECTLVATCAEICVDGEEIIVK